MRVVRALAVSGLVFTLAAGLLTAPASAEPVRPAPPNGTAPLPPGFRVDRGDAGPVLIWRAPKPVPVGDAAVEFFAGDRRLGRPRPAADRRTFALDLSGVRLNS
ncbi:MAG TPA: hypothetical protein VFT95_13690, partial [Micromonosporaceae bacterium]|nr:hypothetical protein [Micromonosporaceae bacterium]